MKRVIIVNAGGRWELSAEKGDYDDLTNHLQRKINALSWPDGEPVAIAEIVTSVEDAEAKLNMTDVIIFVTAGLLQKAREIKVKHPRRKVIVLTGNIPREEVVMLDKGWLGSNRDVMEIVVKGI